MWKLCSCLRLFICRRGYNCGAAPPAASTLYAAAKSSFTLYICFARHSFGWLVNDNESLFIWCLIGRLDCGSLGALGPGRATLYITLVSLYAMRVLAWLKVNVLFFIAPHTHRRPHAMWRSIEIVSAEGGGKCTHDMRRVCCVCIVFAIWGHDS